jgi:hypothetical protein
MQDSSARARIDRQADSFRPLEEDSYDEDAQLAEAEKVWRSQVRRGALWGAGAGFIFGLMPLVALTLLGAITGGLISRATHMRIDRVSAPRIHFARRMNSQGNR